MLLKFFISGQCYEVSLVNGMSLDQLIDRIVAAGVPLKSSVRRNLDERDGWCQSVTRHIRSARRDHQWLAIVNQCAEGMATLTA